MGQIVRGQRDRDPVAEQNPDPELPHPATELGANRAALLEPDLELSAGKDLIDEPFDLT